MSNFRAKVECGSLAFGPGRVSKLLTPPTPFTEAVHHSNISPFNSDSMANKLGFPIALLSIMVKPVHTRFRSVSNYFNAISKFSKPKAFNVT